MNTEYLLLGLYGKPSLELEEVCKAIGMKIQTAYNKRSSGTFPIPMRGKPLIADVRDVAIYMDEQRVDATKLLRQFSSAL